MCKRTTYIGITTPDTISSSNPAQFKNEDGEIIYTFGGAEIYDLVQASIDAAEAAGADYVIALSHVGYDASGELFDITDIVENTDGLDVVLDAHAHLGPRTELIETATYEKTDATVDAYLAEINKL